MGNLTIGALIYLATLIPKVDRLVVKLSPHAEAIGNVLSSYSFTVAGFLSVVATFLYTLGDKPYFKAYSKRGNFGDLMLLHALALVVLAGIFSLSIVMLVKPELLRLSLALTALSLLQLGGLTLISYTLTTRAQDDGAPKKTP